MKAYGRTVKVTKDFKVRIPKTLLDQMNICPGSKIIIQSEHQRLIIISKAKAICLVTGNLSEDFDIFFNKLIISKEGQRILLNELKEKFNFFEFLFYAKY